MEEDTPRTATRQSTRTKTKVEHYDQLSEQEIKDIIEVLYPKDEPPPNNSNKNYDLEDFDSSLPITDQLQRKSGILYKAQKMLLSQASNRSDDSDIDDPDSEIEEVDNDNHSDNLVQSQSRANKSNKYGNKYIPIIENPNETKCHICHYQFPTNRSLRDHMHVHAVDKPFGCTKCGFRFNQEKTLELHYKAVHGVTSKSSNSKNDNKRKRDEIPEPVCVNGMYLCSYNDCSFSYMSKDMYDKHMVMHRGETPPPADKFKCVECGYKFSNQKDLDMHMVCHQRYHQQRSTGQSPKLEVSFIPRSAATKHNSNNSNNHDKIQPSERYKCPKCKIYLSSLGELMKHTAQHKDDVSKKVFCGDCGKGFASMDHVNSHKLIYHPKQSEDSAFFKCPHCGISSKNKTMYDYHMQSHRGEKPFPCKLCDKRFNVQSTLDAHMLAMHEHVNYQPIAPKNPKRTPPGKNKIPLARTDLPPVFVPKKNPNSETSVIKSAPASTSKQVPTTANNNRENYTQAHGQSSPHAQSSPHGQSSPWTAPFSDPKSYLPSNFQTFAKDLGFNRKWYQ